MRGPSWLTVLLAVIMIAAAVYCASRLVFARVRRQPDERDVDLVHTVMGVAMAGMLVSWLNPLPDRVWVVMFGTATGWFGWRAWRSRRAPAAAGDGRPSHAHHLPHLVKCAAMVYMLLAAHAVNAGPGPGVAMGGPAAAGRFPVLALILAVFMAGYVMWQADRLPSPARAGAARATQATSITQATGTASATGTAPGLVATAGPAATPGPRALSPRLAACCQIAMGVTMGYMLVLML